VIIDSLRSILRTDSTAHTRKDGPIRLLHPSLYDFFTNRAENDFRIDVIEQNQTLAIRCLLVLNSQLKFDICKIGDPSLLNEEISKTVSQHLSGGLRYSCRSFVYHIAKVTDPNSVLISALKEFVCEHLLHWIETMSLLEAVSKAEECLRVLANWMKVSLRAIYFPGIG
jgi:hypothetical protein